MGFVERRPNEVREYRARYRDPLGQQRSKSFSRKADAQRFLLEMESDKARGSWIDPRGADMALAVWAEEFLRLSRRLSPTSQQTYRRDLDKYVLPRFGAYRVGRLPADEIENWLNDEIDAGIAPSSVHRFAFHRGAEYPVAGCGPGVGAGGDGGGLSRSGSTDCGLVAVTAAAPGFDEDPLLAGEVGVLGERVVYSVVGDEVGALVQPFGVSVGDPFLDAEHLDGGEPRLLGVGDLNDVFGREEVVDHGLEARRSNE